MAGNWLTRFLETIADRGLDLFRMSSEGAATGDVAALCHALLEGEGEASGIALSREILSQYQGMNAEQKTGFFELLLNEFSSDPEQIRQCADAYLASRSQKDFLRLTQAVEPPRQELLRRLNMAPNATAQLVHMRGALIACMKERPEFAAVDADFRHLLSSWFNRGFLKLGKIDWYTPAHILEKLINYEAVHAIRGWDDLRRRLMNDRRCFAFFHPALPDEPLIFVEVALVKDMPAHIQPLLDVQSQVLPLEQADTAVFYSINNTQDGLRGISFGNFLIKQVLEELQAECPWIERFVTLSPMPRFASSLQAAIQGKLAELPREKLEAILQDWAEALPVEEEGGTLAQSLLSQWQASPGDERLSEAMEHMCLAYLTQRRENGYMMDPVASFHLSNGARLERINVNADPSSDRQQESFGCMVNYLYEPEQVERNHELFISGKEIPLSKQLARSFRKIQGVPANSNGVKAK